MSRTTHSKSESVVTSASLLDDVKSLTEKVAALLGPAAQLTQTQVRRSTKLRKGGEGVFPEIVALSEQLGVVVPSHPTKAMVEKMNLAQSLVPLQKELAKLTKHVSDALFLAHAQSWAGAGAHYTMLRHLSKTDGDLARGLLPVAQFFAARSAAVTAEAKEKRGGARKGTKKPKAPPSSDAAAKDAGTPGALPAPPSGTPSSDAASSVTTPANGAAAAH